MSEPAIETRTAQVERDDRGSILLPVIIVLLLIASAAAAMTLQAKVSLRDASVRRDRLVLGFMADALTRSAAVALAQAAAVKGAPPFAIDGTPQSCWLPAHRQVVLAVQDQGGLIDLNKAPAELLARVFTQAGLGGTGAKALSDAILARRDTGAPISVKGMTSRAPPPRSTGLPSSFDSADQIEGLPGVTPDLFNRLRSLFTVGSATAGVDPIVAAPALRALISRREMNAPEFKTYSVPSAHAGFDIKAVVTLPSGMRFTRHAAFRLDPSDGPGGRFAEWDAPVDTAPLAPGGQGAFCGAFAEALSAT